MSMKTSMTQFKYKVVVTNFWDRNDIKGSIPFRTLNEAKRYAKHLMETNPIVFAEVVK